MTVYVSIVFCRKQGFILTSPQRGDELTGGRGYVLTATLTVLVSPVPLLGDDTEVCIKFVPDLWLSVHFGTRGACAACSDCVLLSPVLDSACLDTAVVLWNMFVSLESLSTLCGHNYGFKASVTFLYNATHPPHLKHRQWREQSRHLKYALAWGVWFDYTHISLDLPCSKHRFHL